MLSTALLWILASSFRLQTSDLKLSGSETLAEVTVHGNVATPDEQVVQLAGLNVGQTITPALVDEAAARLRATKRFQHVEIRTRYASLSDPSQILLVVIVDEGPVTIERTGD